MEMTHSKSKPLYFKAALITLGQIVRALLVLGIGYVAFDGSTGSQGAFLLFAFALIVGFIPCKGTEVQELFR